MRAKLSVLLSERQDIDDGIDNGDGTELENVEVKSLKALISSFDAELAERMANVVSCSKAAGRSVDLGDTVQLMHVRSGYFVTMLKSRAALEHSSMALSIVQFGYQLPTIFTHSH